MKPHHKWTSEEIAIETMRRNMAYTKPDKPIRWAFVLPIVAICSVAVWAFFIHAAVNALAPCGMC